MNTLVNIYFFYIVVTKANIKFSYAKELLMRLSRHGLRRGTGLATMMTLALALTVGLFAVAALTVTVTVMAVLGRGGPIGRQQVGSAQLHVVIEVHPELTRGTSV